MTRDERSTGELDDFLIAWSGPSKFAAPLAAKGFRLVRLPADGSPPAGTDRPPRIVLFAAQGTDPGPLLERIRAVRLRWPLTDTLVSAPEATPSLVRDLLQAGVRDVLFDADESTLSRCIEDALASQQLLPLVERLAERRVRSSRFEGMLSRSHAMWDVFEACARVASTDVNVLICGETGTGKELLARALHRQSKRRGRFVAVNCSSLPEHLIESELFGYEKGAFTGAVRTTKGIFRHADAGTVLLDEIGDMSPAAQQSLLRVLEQRTVRPVGGSDEIRVDVRVVAATQIPLEAAVAEGSFREDLFYRLDVIRLDIPPLRERPEDIVFLFGHFLKSLAKHYGVERPKIGDEFLARLTAHSWPGNVRELENFSERIVLLGKRAALSARDFARLVRTTESPVPNRAAAAVPEPDPRAAPTTPGIDASRTLADTLAPICERVERAYFEALLQSTGGRMQVAARRAGISRRTLQRKLQAHGIDKDRFRAR